MYKNIYIVYWWKQKFQYSFLKCLPSDKSSDFIYTYPVHQQFHFQEFIIKKLVCVLHKDAYIMSDSNVYYLTDNWEKNKSTRDEWLYNLLHSINTEQPLK